MSRYEVAGKEEDPEGLWSRSAKFCVLKAEKNDLCNYTKGLVQGCWKNDLTRNGFGRKRRSFGEINKMVIFREDVSKDTSYLFKTKIYFREKF